jgi:drug/metabolite transporter (DMT)-like permease
MRRARCHKRSRLLAGASVTNPAIPEPAENSMRGIMLMLGAFVTFSCMDTISKLLGTMGYPAVFITWGRLLAQIVLLMPLVIHQGGLPVLRTRHPRSQFLRGIGMLGAGVFFISGLHYLPLATMTAINFVGPFVVTILSIIFLKEKVGSHRWIAILVGFAGALVIIRPGGASFHWASLFAVAGACGWSVAVICTRLVQRDDPTLTTLMWTAIVGFIGCSLMLPFFWVTPTPLAVLLLIAMSIGGTAGQFLMIRALRYAGASVLAPFAYSQIIWSTALGYIIWSEFPDQWTWLGAAIIVACGLYVWYRERMMSTPGYRKAA